MFQTLAYGPPVITIDVEDWPQSTWDRNLPITERAAHNTRRLLRLLREAGVRTTMFVLGRFAECFPDVVLEIQQDGHEVASHGYAHVNIAEQSPKEFLADVSRSKDLLEQIIGEKVRGYRAPDFSVVRRTLWSLDVLAEAGFEYDSSIVPARLSRYGIPEWPVHPVQARLAGDKSIVEVPLATCRRWARNWPIGGGGYHRLLPGFLSRYLAGRVMAEVPFVYYCHPYEFDVREFREIPIPLPLSVRIHQGVGRRWFEDRFLAFVRRFGGRRMQDLLASRRWPALDLQAFLLKFSANGLPELGLTYQHN